MANVKIEWADANLKKFGKDIAELNRRFPLVLPRILKYLSPKETPAGVVARPFGKPTLFPKSFMMGGSFPARKTVEKWKGHVMFRNRSSGRHYTFARSGVFIPVEMTTGETMAAFERIAGPLLQQRVEAAIAKLLK